MCGWDQGQWSIPIHRHPEYFKVKPPRLTKKVLLIKGLLFPSLPSLPSVRSLRPHGSVPRAPLLSMVHCFVFTRRHAGDREVGSFRSSPQVSQVPPSFLYFLRNEALDLIESYSEQIGEKMWMELPCLAPLSSPSLRSCSKFFFFFLNKLGNRTFKGPVICPFSVL